MKASGLFCVMLALGAVGFGAQALAGYALPHVHGDYSPPRANSPHPAHSRSPVYGNFQHSQFGEADRAQWPREHRLGPGVGIDIGDLVVAAPGEDSQSAQTMTAPYAIPVAAPVYVAAPYAPLIASSGPRIIYVNANTIAKEAGAQPQIIYGRPPSSHAAMPRIIYGDTVR